MAKSSSRQRSSPPRSRPSAPPERRRHQGGIIRENIIDPDRPQSSIVTDKARFSSALEVYLWHGIISASEYQAGSRFQQEYGRCVLGIRTSDKGSGAHGDPEMWMISAIHGNALLRKAYKYVAPHRLEVVLSVCVENFYAATSRRRRYLQLGLSDLVSVWQIV